VRQDALAARKRSFILFICVAGYRCKEEKEHRAIHRKGEREKDWERGWGETAWNGWNGMLGEMYVRECSAHTRGCWHPIIILPPRARGFLIPVMQTRPRGAMEYFWLCLLSFSLC